MPSCGGNIGGTAWTSRAAAACVHINMHSCPKLAILRCNTKRSHTCRCSSIHSSSSGMSWSSQFCTADTAGAAGLVSCGAAVARPSELPLELMVCSDCWTQQ